VKQSILNQANAKELRVKARAKLVKSLAVATEKERYLARKIVSMRTAEKTKKKEEESQYKSKKKKNYMATQIEEKASKSTAQKVYETGVRATADKDFDDIKIHEEKHRETKKVRHELYHKVNPGPKAETQEKHEIKEATAKAKKRNKAEEVKQKKEQKESSAKLVAAAAVKLAKAKEAAEREESATKEKVVKSEKDSKEVDQKQEKSSKEVLLTIVPTLYLTLT